ncbi:MAG: LysR family transcriptional regulator [Oscillospiraceae bacterium]|nr:LysR family transcriptional regulator [Oscillospiraceae bacterium]
MVNEVTVKSFLTLARVGSFTEAARQLYLSQQAVSKHVAKLEQDLDCTLFNRERGNLSLTEAGKIYFDAFTQMEETLRAAREEAGRQEAGWGDTLVVGLPELLDLQPLIRRLTAAFREEYPNAHIVYKSAPHWTVLKWLEDGSADVAFTFEEEVANRDWARYLVIDVLQEMLVVSADHPKATPEASYLDFKDERMFFSPDPSTGGAEIVAELERMGFSGDQLVRTENLLSSMASVEQGQGVTLLLEYCKLLHGEHLRVYPTNETSTVVLAYRRSTKKRCARRFVEAAHQRFIPLRP